jgi:NAD(P)H dehydrogenase (quinone)
MLHRIHNIIKTLKVNMEKNFLLILFYSASGSVKNLAHAIADGAEESNIKVKIRTVPKVSSKNEKVDPSIPYTGEIYCTKDDLINCGGMAIGSPTRFGSMASPMKYFLDSTGDLWATNALENKPGIAFTSTSSMHGGQESTLFNLITFMLHQGMLIAGTPYSVDELNKTKSGGTPYGPTHVENFNSSNELTKDEYEIARKTGMRLANLIINLNG